MALSTSQPNNAKIQFRGKAERERRMPVVSKAQNGAMHSAAEGKSALGIPKKVGKEFTADQKPGSVKKLPERVSSKAASLHRRGLISDKQRDKMMKG